MKQNSAVRRDRLWRVIGDAVRRAREESGIPEPIAFALTVGLSRQTLNNIELGKTGTRVEILYRIAKASGKPITFFLPPAEEA